MILSEQDQLELHTSLWCFTISFFSELNFVLEYENQAGNVTIIWNCVQNLLPCHISFVYYQLHWLQSG